MINKDYSWFGDWWLQAASLRGRPWTAALLLAPPGLQVGRFARELAAGLLCQQRLDSGEPCGQCAACAWVSQGQHPDFRWIRPDADREADGEAIEAATGEGEGSADGASGAAFGAEGPSSSGAGSAASSSAKASREIRIDQIRGLLGFSQISSHRGDVRVALIGPVERLNFASANALLKGLEEPQSGMRFLLYGESLMGVPATILSRCRRLRLTAPANLVAAHRPGLDAVSATLLPLMRQGRIDALGWAQAVEKLPPAHLIQFLVLWLTDLALVLRGLEPSHFQEEASALKAMARPLAAQGAAAQQNVSLAQQGLLARMRSADHPLNPRLHVESILGDFSRAFQREWTHAGVC